MTKLDQTQLSFNYVFFEKVLPDNVQELKLKSFLILKFI